MSRMMILTFGEVSNLQNGSQDWNPGLFLFKPMPSATTIKSYWLLMRKK